MSEHQLSLSYIKICINSPDKQGSEQILYV